MILENLQGKVVHFIGIGGVSMSGIAKCFAEHNIFVQGSDSALYDSKYINNESSQNIKLFGTHISENITSDVSLIVKTSTVKDDNPEIIRARELGIEIIERFEALEMIISSFKVKIGVSGSSGKTTTTALVWQALYSATGIMPSCVIGTILNEVNRSVFVNDNSDVCVIEADESDGSFADMNFTVAVITDIDTDHLDHKRYSGNRVHLIEHFHQFALKTLTNGGTVIYNSDCKVAYDLIQELPKKYKEKIISYSGIQKVTDIPPYIKGDCYLEEAKNVVGGVYFSCNGIVSMNDVFINMIGKINAFNALPGVILANILYNFQDNKCFSNFHGVNKRCEIVGEVENVIVIDDYAHSPKKIKAFISSFASYCKDINANFVVICEPHKYTRVESLYNDYITCFDACDYLIMMEIFGVQGRGVISHISSQNLVNDIEKRWNLIKNTQFYIKNLQNNKNLLLNETFLFTKEFFNINTKCFYVFLGAGFSNKYAHLLYNKLTNSE